MPEKEEVTEEEMEEEEEEEVVTTVPSGPGLVRTQWKLAGIADSLSNVFTEIEPSDCEECYTLTFDTESTFSVLSVMNAFKGEYTVNNETQNIYIDNFEAIEDIEADDGELFIDPFLKKTIQSFSLSEDELKLYYDNKQKYLLFKLMIDFKNIENLWEQPLSTIKKCVEGKWKWIHTTRWGANGAIRLTDVFVEITEDQVIIISENYNSLQITSRSFTYKWEKKRKTYEYVFPLDYITYVMCNIEQDNGLYNEWHFEQIQNDRLIVFSDDIHSYDFEKDKIIHGMIFIFERINSNK